MLGQALSVLTYVLVHSGRRLERLTTADLLAYGQGRRALGKPSLGVVAAQQLLYELGIVDQPAPTKGVRWRVGQRTMAELVDRYRSPAARSATCSCATWRNAPRPWTTPPCQR